MEASLSGLRRPSLHEEYLWIKKAARGFQYMHLVIAMHLPCYPESVPFLIALFRVNLAVSFIAPI